MADAEADALFEAVDAELAEADALFEAADANTPQLTLAMLADESLGSELDHLSLAPCGKGNHQNQKQISVDALREKARSLLLFGDFVVNLCKGFAAGYVGRGALRNALEL